MAEKTRRDRAAADVEAQRLHYAMAEAWDEIVDVHDPDYSHGMGIVLWKHWEQARRALDKFNDPEWRP